LLSGANESRRQKAEDGLRKILGRDSKEAILALEEAETKLNKQKEREAKRFGFAEMEEGAGDVTVEEDDSDVTGTTKIAASTVKATTAKTTEKEVEKGTQKAVAKSTQATTAKSVEKSTQKSTEKMAAGTQKGTQKAK
jgi:hypothetical protein